MSGSAPVSRAPRRAATVGHVHTPVPDGAARPGDHRTSRLVADAMVDDAQRLGLVRPGDPVEEARRRHRFWRVVGPLFGVVWVVFLAEPLQVSWANPDPVLRWTGVVGVLLTAGAFAFTVFAFSNGSRRRAGRGGRAGRVPRSLLLALTVLGVVLASLAAREHGLAGIVFVATTAVFLYPGLRTLLVPIVLGVAAAVLPRVVPGWEPEDDTISALLLATLATFGFAQLLRRNVQLQEAQEQVAALAVADERARLGRDLHDVLGHSLTVIAVKAELASRLVDVDRDRAAAEVADIQALARTALADVRAMASTTREVSLAGELAAARRAFDAGGIRATLPGAVDVVPERLREPFAWAVREGTTNVLRHAAATRAVVTLAADRLVVDDDGRGAAPSGTGAQGGAAAAHGNGLQGLRERAAAAGARVETGPSPLGGFRLAVLDGGAGAAA